MSPRAPHRFHHPGPIGPRAPGERLLLPVSESHHLIDVLRLREGTPIDLFDAAGATYRARFVGRRDGCAEIELLAPLDSASPAGPVVKLAVAMLKRRAMDLLIEKLSELGVDTLQPLHTRRSVIPPRAEDEPGVPERWSRLAIAAAKQCGRPRPLSLPPPMAVEHWLQADRPPADGLVAAFGGNPRPLGEWLRQRPALDRPIWIAIGPEGGWTPAEQAAFESAGYVPVGLGPLTLRAETAAIAAAAACRLM